MDSKVLIFLIVSLNIITGYNNNLNIPSKVFDDLKSICLGNWTERSRFRLLSAVTQLYRGNRSLHLSKTYCQTLTNKQVNFPNTLTSYITSHKKHIFLFVGLSDMITGNGTKFEIEFNRKILTEMKSRFLLVVWLRENQSTNYTVDYQYDVVIRAVGQPEISRSTGLMKRGVITSKQIIFDDQWLNTSILNTSFITEVMPRAAKTPNKNPGVRIDETYIIFCANQMDDIRINSYLLKNCYPRESYLQTNKIYCECGPGDRESVDLVIAIFWLIFAVLLIIPFLVDSINTNIEQDLLIFSACNYKNALFQYKITIRLGRVTKRFNRKNSFIDIQFFNSEKESLGKELMTKLLRHLELFSTTGPEVRIPAKLLKSRNVNDIVIQMFRLTKIPDIDKIFCGHNGARTSGVYLFGLSVETVKHYGSEEPIETQYIVQKYIFRDKRFINTVKKENLKEEELNNETNISTALITTAELSYYQEVWLMFVAYTIFGFTAFTIQFNVNAYDFVNYCLAIIATFTIAGSIGYVLLFVLRYLNRCDQIQVILMNSTNSYWCLKIFYYLVTAILAFALQRALFVQGQNIDIIETFYWLSATFFCCSIFTSICIVSYELQKMLAPEDEESMKDESSASISNSFEQSNKLIK